MKSALSRYKKMCRTGFNITARKSTVFSTLVFPGIKAFFWHWRTGNSDKESSHLVRNSDISCEVEL